MDKKMTVKDAELRLEQLKNGKIPPIINIIYSCSERC